MLQKRVTWSGETLWFDRKKSTKIMVTPIAKGAQNDWKQPMISSKSWNYQKADWRWSNRGSQCFTIVIWQKKINENHGDSHCKGCPEWLKTANDFIKVLKLPKGWLEVVKQGEPMFHHCDLTEKNQRKSWWLPLQRVPRMIENSQWFCQSLEILKWASRSGWGTMSPKRGRNWKSVGWLTNPWKGKYTFFANSRPSELLKFLKYKKLLNKKFDSKSDPFGLWPDLWILFNEIYFRDARVAQKSLNWLLRVILIILI